MRMRYKLFIHPVETSRDLWFCFVAFMYDHWNGVETGTRNVPRSSENSDCLNYNPTEPKYLRWAFRNLPPVVAKEYSFIDFGSGKGRVLVAAAKHPFLNVIGVEYSQTLHKAALANIRAAKRLKCTSVTSVCMDAQEFQIPETPCVLYFYNPFKGRIMERVLSNIRGSLLRVARPLFLIYVNPCLHEVFVRQPGLSLLKSGNWCNLYSWKAQS